MPSFFSHFFSFYTFAITTPQWCTVCCVQADCSVTVFITVGAKTFVRGKLTVRILLEGLDILVAAYC